MDLLTMLFLGLCAIVVMFQAVPAVIMFTGIVKGLFFKTAEVHNIEN